MTLRELLKETDVTCVSHQVAELFIEDQIVKSNVSVERIAELYKSTIKDLIEMKGCSATGEIVVLKELDYSSNEPVLQTLYRADGDNRRYGIELKPWKDLIELNVCKKSIEKYGKEIVAAQIIYEMTFFGLTERTHRKESKKTVKSIEKSKKCKKGFTVEEVFAKLGLKVSEETEEKKQRRRERISETVKRNNEVYKEFGFETVEEDN